MSLFLLREADSESEEKWVWCALCGERLLREEAFRLDEDEGEDEYEDYFCRDCYEEVG